MDKKRFESKAGTARETERDCKINRHRGRSEKNETGKLDGGKENGRKRRKVACGSKQIRSTEERRKETYRKTFTPSRKEGEKGRESEREDFFHTSGIFPTFLLQVKSKEWI